MRLMQWLAQMFSSSPHAPKVVKDRLTRRQDDVADRLARMQGKTRDEVFAEAYRRADKILKQRP